MQPLNHDMDELFRKAGENYPLNTGDGDWDGISGKLLTAAGAATLKKEEKNKRTKYYPILLLFLLVISGWFIFTQVLQHKNKIRSNDISSLGAIKQPDGKTNMKKDNNVGVTSHKIETIKSQPEDYKKDKNTTGNSAYNNTKLFLPYILINKRSHKGINERQQDKIHKPAFIPLQQITTSNNTISIVAYILKDSLTILPDIRNLMRTAPDPIGTNVSINKAATTKQKGLYIGLMGGPDFSEVRSQGMTKTGYNAGVLLGYRFNRSLSVESGVLWSRKKYYSDGKYFSLSKVGASMPAGMKIMSVEGQSSLFEFPLKLKYDFIRKEKSDFFFTAGISSNVYVKEKNNYETMMNGVQENATGLYDELPCSWFSLINISTGYEHTLARSYSIRFEPYIKIPLKKVGMGSLPVFSAGITIAVSNLFSGQ